jgi:hypothetical protein
MKDEPDWKKNNDLNPFLAGNPNQPLNQHQGRPTFNNNPYQSKYINVVDLNIGWPAYTYYSILRNMRVDFEPIRSQPPQSPQKQENEIQLSQPDPPRRSENRQIQPSPPEAPPAPSVLIPKAEEAAKPFTIPKTKWEYEEEEEQRQNRNRNEFQNVDDIAASKDFESNKDRPKPQPFNKYGQLADTYLSQQYDSRRDNLEKSGEVEVVPTAFYEGKLDKVDTNFRFIEPEPDPQPEEIPRHYAQRQVKDESTDFQDPPSTIQNVKNWFLGTQNTGHIVRNDLIKTCVGCLLRAIINKCVLN